MNTYLALGKFLRTLVRSPCDEKLVDELRTFYAKYVVSMSGSDDKRLVSAFSSVKRERFVGPGPWQIPTLSGCISTGTQDPSVLYQDILVSLAPERGINNGQPTLHGKCIAALNITGGSTVVHIGAGTGYYTAILAHMVGPNGKVIAYEMEPDLAQLATVNLSDLKSVTVICGSGTSSVLPNADYIYVSAGATHPLQTWMDALSSGGRLLFPLTPNEGLGGMLMVTKHENSQRFDAKFICDAFFIPCSGARDQLTAKAVYNAFNSSGTENVRTLWLEKNNVDESVWCVGNGWWLSTK